MVFFTFQAKIAILIILLIFVTNSERPTLIQTTQVHAFNQLHRAFGIEKILLLAPQDCRQCQTLKHDIFQIINEMKLAKRVSIYAVQTYPGTNLQIRSYDSNGNIKMLLSGVQSIKDLKFFLKKSLGRDNAHSEQKMEKGFVVQKLTNEDKLIKNYDQKVAQKKIMKIQAEKLAEKASAKFATLQQPISKPSEKKIYTKVQQQKPTQISVQKQPQVLITGTSTTAEAINQIKNTLNNINTQNLKKQALQIQNKTKQIAATLTENKPAYYILIGITMVMIGWLICKLTKKQDQFMSIPNNQHQHFQMSEKISLSQL